MGIILNVSCNILSTTDPSKNRYVRKRTVQPDWVMNPDNEVCSLWKTWGQALDSANTKPLVKSRRVWGHKHFWLVNYPTNTANHFLHKHRGLYFWCFVTTVKGLFCSSYTDIRPTTPPWSVQTRSHTHTKQTHLFLNQSYRTTSAGRDLHR